MGRKTFKKWINEKSFSEIEQEINVELERKDYPFQRKIYLERIRDDAIDFRDYPEQFYRKSSNEKDKTNRLIELLDSFLSKLSLDGKEQGESDFSGIKWKGSQAEFMELSKSLFEAGIVDSNQKELVEKLSGFFGIKINHPDKTLQDIKSRSHGAETKFLDKLKRHFNNYLER